MTIWLSLLVAIAGLVIYLVSVPHPTPRWQEVGRIMFFAGLLAFLLLFTKVISVLSGGSPVVR
jgi:O-antigen ligase